MQYIKTLRLRIASMTIAVLGAGAIAAQAPYSTNYQAVVRDALGDPMASTSVTIRFTVRSSSIGGPIQYQETQGLITNALGLITTRIGEGTPISGAYATVNWSASDQFLQVEVNSGAGYQDLGTSRLNSVPYSLYARTTGNALSLADTDNDTKVQVEEGPDDDIIRFDMAGTEFFRMDSGRFEVLNTGRSVFMGEGAGANDWLSLTGNTFIGYEAGMMTGSGPGNVAVGKSALSSNTLGQGNIAVGYEAMRSSTGSQSIAIGTNALVLNANSNNIAIGHGAISSTGVHTGWRNVTVGGSSMQENLSGDYNVAVGHWALRNNRAGDGTVALGAMAMENANSSSTGFFAENTAVGYMALRGPTAHAGNTGTRNTAIGAHSLEANTSGWRNVSLGFSSLYTNTTGSSNVAIGYEALFANVTGGSNSAIGFEALRENTGDLNTAHGFQALRSNNSGLRNAAVGAEALRQSTAGTENSALGFRALYANGVGNFNTAVGALALEDNNGGLRNTSVGHSALTNNTTGGNNTAVGVFALESNTTAGNNTALGFSAHSNTGSYTNSTGIGYDADPSGSNRVQLGNIAVGTIGGYAAWSNLSDGRFKTDVRENVEGLAFVMKLRPVTYHLDMGALAAFNRTADSLRLPEAEAVKAAELQVGFIAQEVEEAARSLGFDFHGVDEPQDVHGHYALRYAEFVPSLVKALQEQQTMIIQQSKLIDELTRRLDGMTDQGR